MRSTLRERLGVSPRAIATLLALVACDAQITPPAELPSIAISLRDVPLFATVGSTTPDSATITFSNNGGGTLAGLTVQGPVYGAGGSGWLTTALQDTTLWLVATAENLGVGTYTAELDVLVTGASNSPRGVMVTFFVGESELIALSQDSLTFTATAGGAIPPAQSLTISNGGDGVLRELAQALVYPAGGEQDWLTAALSSTTAPTTLLVQPQRVLPAGIHTATLRVRSPLSDPDTDSAQVVFVIAPPPAVLISADEIVIDAAEGSTAPIRSRVTVDEKNRRTLTATVAPGAAWLSTSADTIVTPAELELIADPSGLALGTHMGLVAVSSGGGAADTIVVNLVIRAMPTVEASLNEVQFTAYRTGPIPVAQAVRIENAGAYSLSGLSLSVVPATDWLTATLDATVAPATIALQVDPAQIAPGTTGNAAVIVTGTAARPDTVLVSFSFLDGPHMALSSDSVTVRAATGQSLPLPQSVGIANDGEGSLSGSGVSGMPTWLGATLSGTTAPADLALQPNTTALAPGLYRADLSLTSGVADNSPQNLTVVYEVGTANPPLVQLSPDSVSFVATPVDTVEQIIHVQNVGGGTLTLGTVIVPSWLSAQQLPGSDPSRLRLTVSTAGLTPGTYGGAVVISSNAASSPDTLPVVLDLLSSPSLLLSADTVRFRTIRGEVPPFPTGEPQTVLVFNESTGLARDLVATEVVNWLDVSGLASGTAPDSIDVTLTPQNPAGTYAATVQVRSATTSIPTANLVVIHERQASLPPPADPPAPTTSPARVRFVANEGAAVGTQVVRIDNEGGGSVNALAIGSAPAWIVPSLGGTAAPTRLTLGVDISGLVPNTTYSGDVVITSSAGDIAVPVSLNMLGRPSLSLTTDTLRFSTTLGHPAPPAQVILASNEGAGILSGLTVGGAPIWISASLASDTATTTLTVSVDPATLGAGTHTATLQVASPTAANSPQSIAVVLDIAPGAQIVLSADSIRFVTVESGPAATARSIRIENGGSGSLTGLALASVPAWLSASLAADSAPTELALTPIAAMAPTGTSTGAISITSDVAAPASLPVVLTKRVGPEIATSGSEVVFRVYQGQATPDSQMVTVSNAASGALDDAYVDAASVPAWLRVSPAAPTTSPLQVILGVTNTSFAPGTYGANLLISSDAAGNSPVSLNVQLEIDPGPSVVASPVRLTMTGVAGSATPDTQSVTVSNAGKGDLGSILATVDAPWLSVQVDSSVTPGSVIVVADPGAAAAGSLDGAVTIRAANADDPVTVPVTFDVVSPPEIELSPTTLVFHATVGDPDPPAAQVVSVFDVAGRSLGTITVDSTTWLAPQVDSTTVPATLVLQPTTVLDVLGSPYRATIEVGSGAATNSPQRLEVLYHIDLGGRPVIRLSRDSLTFSRANPAAQTVAITNGGSRALRDLRVVDLTDSDWLFVLLDSRVAPATLTVAIDAAQAASATANSVASLQISAEGAESKVLTVILP